MPGCGKTVLSATILNHLAPVDNCVILSFFFDFKDTAKQKLNNLLRSLAFQLYSSHPEAQKDLDNLFTSHDNGESQPDTDRLSTCLNDMMRTPKKVFILLDSLDECSKREKLLSWMQNFIPTLAHVQVVAISQPEDDLKQSLPNWAETENCLLLNKELINADIRSYVKARLEAGEEFKRWAECPECPNILEHIEDTVSSRANEM